MLSTHKNGIYYRRPPRLPIKIGSASEVVKQLIDLIDWPMDPEFPHGVYFGIDIHGRPVRELSSLRQIRFGLIEQYELRMLYGYERLKYLHAALRARLAFLEREGHVEFAA